jgi:RimJ/RimL family protein N-acetyltransferase
VLVTERLQLLPLPAAAAAVLPEDRAGAATLIGASVHDDWPHAELLDMLPMQAAAQSEADELFGVWVIIERASASVVGDIGFFGPPDDNGVVEIGYSLVAPCRGHGYAGEAVRVLLEWDASQPGVL